MIFQSLEIAILAISAIYLIYSRVRIHRQRAAAWDILVAQLRPSCILSESDAIPRNANHDTSLRVCWPQIQTARGLWEMYENAGVMLRIVDFAIHRGAAVDAALLDQLQSDAAQIRISIFYALSIRARTHVAEESRSSIRCVTELYCDMVDRMSGFIQSEAGLLNHDFAASM